MRVNGLLLAARKSLEMCQLSPSMFSDSCFLFCVLQRLPSSRTGPRITHQVALRFFQTQRPVILGSAIK